jgi:EmrB/QacA subfamily drug resistance transporter
MVMIAMFITAIEATIVSTAMPSIVSDLEGFGSYALVFSIFLLMQAVSIPIYGKLSDLYGRKPIFLIGMTIFLTGSLLCGLAQSMQQLIIYRLIQGLGAGSVQPLAMTIVGDIYTLEERGKIQGYLSSVWAISSVTGPALGGLFVEYISWVWVFWINIPFGIVTMIGLQLFLHEQRSQKKPSIDYTGSVLLLFSIGSLMALFIGGGTLWNWNSAPTYILTPLFAISICLFILWERIAAEPIMPLALWRNRNILISNVTALTSHAVLIGISSFLPMYVQGVMSRTPSIAGITLGMMSIGWSLSSGIGGRYLNRIGLRRMSFIGSLVIACGTIFFILLRPEHGPVFAGIGAFLTGVGLGLLATASLLIVQVSAGRDTRGSATALIMFMRISGLTIGASMLASILNNRYMSYLSARAVEGEDQLQLDDVNLLLDPDRPPLDESTLAALKEGLVYGLDGVYWTIGALALVTCMLIVWLPRRDRMTERQT